MEFHSKKKLNAAHPPFAPSPCLDQSAVITEGINPDQLIAAMKVDSESSSSDLTFSEFPTEQDSLLKETPILFSPNAELQRCTETADRLNIYTQNDNSFVSDASRNEEALDPSNNLQNTPDKTLKPCLADNSQQVEPQILPPSSTYHSTEQAFETNRHSQSDKSRNENTFHPSNLSEHSLESHVIEAQSRLSPVANQSTEQQDTLQLPNIDIAEEDKIQITTLSDNMPDSFQMEFQTVLHSSNVTQSISFLSPETIQGAEQTRNNKYPQLQDNSVVVSGTGQHEQRSDISENKPEELNISKSLIQEFQTATFTLQEKSTTNSAVVIEKRDPQCCTDQGVELKQSIILNESECQHEHNVSGLSESEPISKGTEKSPPDLRLSEYASKENTQHFGSCSAVESVSECPDLASSSDSLQPNPVENVEATRVPASESHCKSIFPS